MTEIPGKDPHLFAAELAGIRELSIRKIKIVEILRGASPDKAARFLNHVIEGAIGGNPDCRMAYLALIKNRNIEHLLGKQRASAIFDFAAKKQYVHVLEFFKSWSLKRQKEAQQDGSSLSSKLIHLTLGEKKAFARRKDYKNLEFLLFDNNPSVISNLLKNPKLTERDVIRVASNRNAPRAVLEEVFKSDRWISRYRIRKALVFNENTPLDIALNLCSSLLKQDLKLIAADGKADPSVLRKVKEVLADKR